MNTTIKNHSETFTADSYRAIQREFSIPEARNRRMTDQSGRAKVQGKRNQGIMDFPTLSLSAGCYLESQIGTEELSFRNSSEVLDLLI